MKGMILVCAREMMANLLMSIPLVAQFRIRRGRTSAAASHDEIARFAFGIVLDHPSVQPLIRGADVLEIGPGDHLATGLTFLACGARSYSAMDRFVGDYSGHAARKWYELVREAWPQHFDTPWPIGLDDFPDLPNVHVIHASTEDVDELPHNAFDLIVSQAVGEHVRSIDSFAAATFKMLKPGGTALHVIDLSCHGFFTNDPYRFLMIAEPVWRMMGSNRGLPNRRRIHEFEAAFSRQGFSRVEILQQSTIDAPVPAQLAHLPEDSARTSWGVFLLVK